MIQDLNWGTQQVLPVTASVKDEEEEDSELKHPSSCRKRKQSDCLSSGGEKTQEGKPKSNSL